jgi:hypothetical protein
MPVTPGEKEHSCDATISKEKDFKTRGHDGLAKYWWSFSIQMDVQKRDAHVSLLYHRVFLVTRTNDRESGRKI